DCISSILQVFEISSTLGGRFDVSINSNKIVLTYTGRTGKQDYFNPGDFVRVPVQVSTTPITGDCSTPISSPQHPRPVACDVTLEAIGPGNYYPTLVHETLVKVRATDLEG